MSTHYIEEAERLCDTVTIMSKGAAVATGSPADLVAQHAGEHAWEVYGPPSTMAEVEVAAEREGWKTRRTGTSVSVMGTEAAPRGFESTAVRRSANLEDVFVLLTGEEIG
jgi:lipooligosaccharide transport system ATP-binding protein